MPQPIARMYADDATATAAADDLLQHGFSAESVHVISQTKTTGSIPEAITATGVSAAATTTLTEGIERGEALVVVNPPFGSARPAIEILAKHDPIAVEVEVASAEPRVTQSVDWTDATPLSKWLGWSVLLSDPAPLSNYLKWPTLKPQPEASTTLENVRKQSLDAAPLSSKIGMPLLSDDPAPLSAKLGWPTLLGTAAPLSEKLGWATLSDDPAPLSSKVGWAVLLDDPTPLSSRLGYKTLSDKQ